eukprot:3281058-Pleurochrysis_carterae.AAC.1
MAARARRDVGRIVAQNVWSKSTPGTCAQPCTQSLAFLVPLRFLLYTQISLTSERPAGTSGPSMVVQLLFCWWLAISARSALPHPTRSSAIACLRVRGSAETWLTAKAHPVPRPHAGLSSRARKARRTAGIRDRRGYSPSVRLKGAGRWEDVCAGIDESLRTEGTSVDTPMLARTAGIAGAGTPAGADADSSVLVLMADGLVERDGSEAKFELSSEAKTRAIRKLKSGGYAACALEFHAFPSLDPPAICACSEC